jgi:hypothetical protein
LLSNPTRGLFVETYLDMSDAVAARPDLISGNLRTLDMGRLADILTDHRLHPPIHGLVVWGAKPRDGADRRRVE